MDAPSPDRPLGEMFESLRGEQGSIFGAPPEQSAPPPPEPPEPPGLAALKLRVEQLRAEAASALAKSDETLARVQQREDAERRLREAFDAAKSEARLEEAKRLEHEILERTQARIRELEEKLLGERSVEELFSRMSRLEADRPRLARLEERLGALEHSLGLQREGLDGLANAVESLRLDRADQTATDDEVARLSQALNRLAEAVELRSDLAALQNDQLKQRLNDLELSLRTLSVGGLAEYRPAVEAVLNDLAKRLGSTL